MARRVPRWRRGWRRDASVALAASQLRGSAVARRAAPAVRAGGGLPRLLAALLGHWQVDRLLRPTLRADDVARLVGERVVLRGASPSGRAAARRDAPGDRRSRAARRGADWQPAHGPPARHACAPAQAWRRGDAVEALVGVRRPRNFGNPGEFDFAAYLARRGIYATAFAADDAAGSATPAAADWAAALERWRDARSRSARGDARRPPTRRSSAALLIGDARTASSDVRDALCARRRQPRPVHLGPARRAGRRRRLRRCCAGCWRAASGCCSRQRAEAGDGRSLAPLALYAAIAGGNVATDARRDHGRRWSSARCCSTGRATGSAPLAAAALAISLVWPGRAGRHLVPALVRRRAGDRARRARASPPGGTRGKRRTWSACAARAGGGCAGWCCRRRSPSAPSLATAPLTAWHFNQVSLIALLANPLVVPLLGLLTVGGRAGRHRGGGGRCRRPRRRCSARSGSSSRVADARRCACARALPGASVRVSTPSLLELALLYGALAALLIPRRAPARAAVLGALPRRPGRRRRVLAASAAPRRAADHLRLRRPGRLRRGRVPRLGGDGGRRRRAARATSTSADRSSRRSCGAARSRRSTCWRCQPRRLRPLRRPDLPRRRVRPDSASGGTARRGTGARFAALRRALRAAGCCAATRRAAALRIGGVEVRVLHPGARRRRQRQRPLADRCSCATGRPPCCCPATSKPTASARWSRRTAAALRSTVLKVPHHGSRTSSTAAFLDAVAPRLAVVSAGADNRFGFPHAAVLDAYREPRRRALAHRSRWRRDAAHRRRRRASRRGTGRRATRHACCSLDSFRKPRA